MKQTNLEQRVQHLEARVDAMEQKPNSNWLKEIYGTFANDPVFDEIVRLGREYRLSLRPKPRKKRQKNAHP